MKQIQNLISLDESILKSKFWWISSHLNQQPSDLHKPPQSAANLSIYQNWSLKKCIFKIALSKNTLQKLLPQKYVFKAAPWKERFAKRLPQKLHFHNCSPNKHSPHSFNLLFIRTITRTFYFSIMFLITFFEHIYTLLKTLASNGFHISWEQNISLLLLSKYGVNLSNFFILKICSFINIRLHVGFQKCFIVDWFAIKLCF